MMYKMLITKKTKIVIVAVLSLAFSVSGLYAKGKNYGAAGCGVGSLIFSSNTKGSQLFAATTNFSSSNTSSITSQTSNCYDEEASSYLRYRQKEFVAKHYADLRKEMAVGRGENLEAFAVLIGCSAPASFASMAQKKYSDFFALPVSSPAEFVERVKTNIKTDSELSLSCKLEA